MSMDVALRRFLGDIERIDQRRKVNVNAVIRGSADRLAGEVIEGGAFSPGTPEDTGFAKNSWVVGVNGPATPRQPSAPPKGLESVAVVSRAEASAAIARVRLGDRVILESNCVYIRPLEHGHSQQAPTGMVALAVLGFQQIVREEIAKVRGR